MTTTTTDATSPTLDDTLQWYIVWIWLRSVQTYSILLYAKGLVGDCP